MLLGALAEGIKFGDTNPKVELPSPEEENQKYGWIYYDYSKMLRLWENVFGAHHIRCGVFQPSRLLNGNVVSDFCTRMMKESHDIETEKFISLNQATKANRRHSAEALFVLSKLNGADGVNPKTNRELISKVDTYKKSILIRPSVLDDFYQKFAESNRQVAQKYFLRNDLFDPISPQYEYFDFEEPAKQIECLTDYMSRLVALTGTKLG